MPWEGAELVVADLIISGESIKAENPKVISGQKKTVSVDQPRWASDDVLLFLNDSSGYVNPWKYYVSTGISSPIFKEPIPEDFAEPAWMLGRSDAATLDSETTLYAATRDGIAVLYLVNVGTGSRKEIITPFTVIKFLAAVTSQKVVFIGSKADETGVVVEGTLSKDGPVVYKVLKLLASPDSTLSSGIVSKAEPMSFLTPPKDESVHVLYYPPFNPNYTTIDQEAPPAVIQVHGGPTIRAETGLSWAIQYWTTRGWAWCVLASSNPADLY